MYRSYHDRTIDLSFRPICQRERVQVYSNEEKMSFLAQRRARTNAPFGFNLRKSTMLRSSFRRTIRSTKNYFRVIGTNDLFFFFLISRQIQGFNLRFTSSHFFS